MEPEWHIENKNNNNNNNNNMTFGISVETCLSWVKKGDVWSRIPTVYIYIHIHIELCTFVYQILGSQIFFLIL